MCDKILRYERLSPGDISPADVEDVNILLFQLATSPRPIDLKRAREIAERSLWIVVRDEEGRIKGMNTLTVSHIPTGRIGHLDDVVVHEELRGRQVGRELVRQLLACARKDAVVDRIELTCKPSRQAANHLYPLLGFERQETNCYLLKW